MAVAAHAVARQRVGAAGAGADAAVVEHMQDPLEDRQLAHRGHFQKLMRPVIGEHVVEANGIRFDSSPHQFTRPAPCLTADSAAVYCDLLGRPRVEFDELADAGVLS